MAAAAGTPPKEPQLQVIAAQPPQRPEPELAARAQRTSPPRHQRHHPARPQRSAQQPSERAFQQRRISAPRLSRSWGSHTGGQTATEPLEPAGQREPRPSRRRPCPRRRTPAGPEPERRAGLSSGCFAQLWSTRARELPSLRARVGGRLDRADYPAAARAALSVLRWRTRPTQSFAPLSTRSSMRRAARLLGALACGISQAHGAQISALRRCCR